MPRCLFSVPGVRSNVGTSGGGSERAEADGSCALFTSANTQCQLVTKTPSSFVPPDRTFPKNPAPFAGGCWFESLFFFKTKETGGGRPSARSGL